MAKFSKSYSLSQPAIDKLQKIADDKGISNSEAIEFLIFQEDNDERIRSIVLQVLHENNMHPEHIERLPEKKKDDTTNEVENNIKNSIADAFKNMK